MTQQQSSRPVTLTFLGASGTVTGSKYLMTIGRRRVVVDAGMFQGEKQWRLKNWEAFPVDPATISDVVITHAHSDHVGYLPALVREGFSGPIWMTEGTRQLAEIVLRDAAKLQQEQAEQARREGWSKHEDPQPLFDNGDVERLLPLIKVVEFEQDVDLGEGLVGRWTRAAHILGSASVRLELPETSVLFSGDLGRHDHPLLKDRGTPRGANYVLCESTTATASTRRSTRRTRWWPRRSPARSSVVASSSSRRSRSTGPRPSCGSWSSSCASGGSPRCRSPWTRRCR